MYYNFRLIPYLYVGEKMYQGDASPISAPYKTDCAAPNSPEIESVSPLVDENKSILTVKWKVGLLCHFCTLPGPIVVKKSKVKTAWFLAEGEVIKRRRVGR